MLGMEGTEEIDEIDLFFLGLSDTVAYLDPRILPFICLFLALALHLGDGPFCLDSLVSPTLCRFEATLP